MNHFYDINDQVRLSSVLYWSGGSGGGTGTYGSVKRLPVEIHKVRITDGTKVHRGHGIGTGD